MQKIKDILTLIISVISGSFIGFLIAMFITFMCTYSYDSTKATTLMPGDNSFVTELFLANNFTPLSGITPGTNNTIWMDCDQIKARYAVSISGITTTGNRLPSQNQIISSYQPVTLTYVSIVDINHNPVSYPTFLGWPILPTSSQFYIKFTITGTGWNLGKEIFFRYYLTPSTYISSTDKNVAIYRSNFAEPLTFPIQNEGEVVDYGNAYIVHDNDFDSDAIKNAITPSPTITHYVDVDKLGFGFNDDATVLYFPIRPVGVWANRTGLPKLMYYVFENNSVVTFKTNNIGVACAFNQSSSFYLAFPNPVASNGRVYFYGFQNINYIELYTQTGQYTYTWYPSSTANEGIQIYPSFAPGSYFFRVYDSDDNLLWTTDKIIIIDL